MHFGWIEDVEVLVKKLDSDDDFEVTFRKPNKYYGDRFLTLRSPDLNIVGGHSGFTDGEIWWYQRYANTNYLKLMYFCNNKKKRKTFSVSVVNSLLKKFTV